MIIISEFLTLFSLFCFVFFFGGGGPEPVGGGG